MLFRRCFRRLYRYTREIETNGYRVIVGMIDPRKNDVARTAVQSAMTSA